VVQALCPHLISWLGILRGLDRGHELDSDRKELALQAGLKLKKDHAVERDAPKRIKAAATLALGARRSQNRPQTNYKNDSAQLRARTWRCQRLVPARSFSQELNEYRSTPYRIR